MRSRRVLVLVLATIALAVGALRALQRDGSSTPAPSTTPATTTATTRSTTTTPAQATTTGTTTASPGGTEADVVTAVFPSATPVRARPGDTIDLRVSNPTADVAKILALGIQLPVGPGIAGTMRFSAGAPGVYPVTLNVAETTVGTIVITDAAS